MVAPIFNADALVAVLIGAFFFQEILSPLNYAAIAVVLLGVFCLGIDFKEIKKFKINDRAVTYAILSMVTFGLASACYKYLSDLMTPFQVITSVNLFGVLIALVVFSPHRKEWEFSRVGWNNYLHIVGISLCILVGVWALTSAFSYGTLSFSSVIAGASPLISVLIARVLFKEYLTPIQYVGAVLTVAGVMLLVW